LDLSLAQALVDRAPIDQLRSAIYGSVYTTAAFTENSEMLSLFCVNFHGKYNLCYNIATQHKVLQIATLLQAKEARQHYYKLKKGQQRSTNLSIDSAACLINGCAIDRCLC